MNPFRSVRLGQCDAAHTRAVSGMLARNTAGLVLPPSCLASVSRAVLHGPEGSGVGVVWSRLSQSRAGMQGVRPGLQEPGAVPAV